MGKLLEEIKKLSVEEQINLLTEAWNNIPMVNSVNSSPELEHILEERLAAHRKNPASGATVDEVIARIQNRW